MIELVNISTGRLIEIPSVSADKQTKVFVLHKLSRKNLTNSSSSELENSLKESYQPLEVQQIGRL